MSTRRLNDSRFLKFHAPLNGHAEDVIGGNNGSWFGDESYEDNQFGIQAAELDGTLDNIVFADMSRISNSVASWSIWYKLDDIAQPFRDILSLTLDTEDYWRLETSASSGDDLQIFSRHSNNLQNLSPTNGVGTDGLWHNAVITLDAPNNELKIYIDGEISATGTWTAPALSAEVRIGARSDAGAGVVTGALGSLRYYNVALTASEVLALYRQTQHVPKQVPVEQPILTSHVPDLSESALVGSWLSHKVAGTADDYGPNGHDGTVVGSWTWDKVGADFDETALDQITLPTSMLASNVCSVEAWIRPTKINDFQTIFTIWTSDDDAFEFFIDSGNARLFGGNFNNKANSASGSIVANQWHHVVLVSDGTTTTIYVNGIASGTTGTTNFSTFTPAGQIARRAGGLEFSGQIRGVNLYSDARGADWIAYRYRKGVPDDSLVLHVTDGTKDYSRYRRTLTPSGGIILGRRMSLDGTDDKLDCGDLGNIRSIGFWVKPTSTSEEMLLVDAGKDIGIVSGTITYTGLTPTATYVDGAAGTTLVAGKWQYVLAVLNADVDANNFEIGTDGSNFGQIDVDDMKAYDDAKTADFGREYYLRTRKFY